MKQLLISGPTLQPDGSVVVKTLQIKHGMITDVIDGHSPEADIHTDNLIATGFVDLQINGGYGHDFGDTPEKLSYHLLEVAARLPETGVTSFLPTLVTRDFNDYPLLLRGVREAISEQTNLRMQNKPGARILGVHLEGPYLNPDKKGAHPQVHIRPINLEEIKTWIDPGVVRMVTLAGELPGALEAIAWLRQKNIVVSLGHSDATFDQAMQAFQAGAECTTHLFNAMRPLHHREPGLIGATFSLGRWFGMIVDGIHIHPEIIRLVTDAYDPNVIILVTDAISAAGVDLAETCVDKFILGNELVRVVEEQEIGGWSARLPDGTLAGSILTMDKAVHNMVKFSGCSLSDAIRMASQNPNRLNDSPFRKRIDCSKSSCRYHHRGRNGKTGDHNHRGRDCLHEQSGKGVIVEYWHPSSWSDGCFHRSNCEKQREPGLLGIRGQEPGYSVSGKRTRSGGRR